MNKKGSEEFLSQTLVDLVMLAIVIVVFLGVILTIKGNEAHSLNVEVRDFALVHDAVIMSNNQINYVYEQKENLEIKKTDNPCLITVKHKENEISDKSFNCFNNELQDKEKIKLDVK